MLYTLDDFVLVVRHEREHLLEFLKIDVAIGSQVASYLGQRFFVDLQNHVDSGELYVVSRKMGEEVVAYDKVKQDKVVYDVF